jgi:predicted alpha/beta hydrolase family esterase
MRVKRHVLFVQGGGEGTHDDWDDKLVASLTRELGPAYAIRYPRMPQEDDPDYVRWKVPLAHEIAALPDGAILVGHSVGATILLKFLTEHPSPTVFGAIILIAAPFVGEGGWPADGLTFPPDLGAHLPDGVAVHFFHGLADDVVPSAHLELYARAMPQGHVHALPGRDHQFDNDLAAVAACILSLEAAQRR